MRETETAGRSGLARDLKEKERNRLDKGEMARPKGGDEKKGND